MSMQKTKRRQDPWVVDEFTKVNDNLGLTDQQIHATLLPGRTIEAIRWVRLGIAQYHAGVPLEDIALNGDLKAALLGRYPRQPPPVVTGSVYAKDEETNDEEKTQ